MPPGSTVRGQHLEGQNMEFCYLATSCELVFALQNGFSGNMCYVITPPQLSVLFVTVCTNAIVVTIRISVADLIGGGSNTDICCGQQTPSHQ